jgi:glycosyltransferase involved in cell wall biosynthesis
VKILQLYKDYYPVLGGIENNMRLLCEGLAARGHEVTALVTGEGLRTTARQLNGVRVIYAARLANLARAPLSPATLSLLAAERPDIVHLHMPYPPGDLAYWLAGRGRLVITYHSDVVSQRRLLTLYAPLLRATLRRASRIIATSPAYIGSSPFLAALAERCTVVPHGIDQRPFAQVDQAAVAAIRARYPGPLSLFVGRLRYYKGADQLVRAMAQVPGHALLIGGDATVRRADLHALAAGLGLAERVHLLGEVADITPYYHAADLFVLPSVERSEAFGIVQIEAQAAGLPIVATELGTGTSYVTLHGQTGFIVPPYNPAALALAMRVLIENPALARAMGQAGRARAQAEFTDQRMIERVEQIYQKALG